VVADVVAEDVGCAEGGRGEACEDVEEGGLAGTVVAENCRYLTWKMGWMGWLVCEVQKLNLNFRLILRLKFMF
jgi:hypothetical protein